VGVAMGRTEVIDYGHPQNSDIEALKLYITQAKNKNKLAAVAVRPRSRK
jgi:hypothetical protein